MLTYQTFTIEEEIIHHLMLQTALIKRNGLLYGKLGISLAFFEWGCNWDNPIYTDFAKELKNSVCKKIEDQTPLDFATGLSGVGWGLEYMALKQLTDNISNEICCTIDQKIMLLNMQRITNFSFETGLEGFLHYILIRIKVSEMRKTPNPFDEDFLTDIYCKLQSLAENIMPSSLEQAFILYMETGLLNYNPDISLFTNNIEIKSIEDIQSAKLGLADGLAGNLLRIINEQKSFKS